MPFDSLPQVETLTLESLAWRLRHPETWPEGFEWDYAKCSRCAMGLAYRLKTGKKLLEIELDGVITRKVRAAIDDARAMKLRDFSAIFWELSPRGLWRDVTPKDVATAIEKYLATRTPG